MTSSQPRVLHTVATPPSSISATNPIGSTQNLTQQQRQQQTASSPFGQTYHTTSGLPGPTVARPPSSSGPYPQNHLIRPPSSSGSGSYPSSPHSPPPQSYSASLPPGALAPSAPSSPPPMMVQHQHQHTGSMSYSTLPPGAAPPGTQSFGVPSFPQPQQQPQSQSPPQPPPKEQRFSPTPHSPTSPVHSTAGSFGMQGQASVPGSPPPGSPTNLSPQRMSSVPGTPSAAVHTGLSQQQQQQQQVIQPTSPTLSAVTSTPAPAPTQAPAASAQAKPQAKPQARQSQQTQPAPLPTGPPVYTYQRYDAGNNSVLPPTAHATINVADLPAFGITTDRGFMDMPKKSVVVCQLPVSQQEKMGRGTLSGEINWKAKRMSVGSVSKPLSEAKKKVGGTLSLDTEWTWPSGKYNITHNSRTWTVKRNGQEVAVYVSLNIKAFSKNELATLKFLVDMPYEERIFVILAVMFHDLQLPPVQEPKSFKQAAGEAGVNVAATVAGNVAVNAVSACCVVQ